MSLSSLWLTLLILAKAAAPVVAVMVYAAAISSATIILTRYRGQG